MLGNNFPKLIAIISKEFVKWPKYHKMQPINLIFAKEIFLWIVKLYCRNNEKNLSTLMTQHKIARLPTFFAQKNFHSYLVSWEM